MIWKAYACKAHGCKVGRSRKKRILPVRNGKRMDPAFQQAVAKRHRPAAGSSGVPYRCLLYRFCVSYWRFCNSLHFIPLKRSGEIKPLSVIYNHGTTSKPFSCLSILLFSSFCASASAIMPKPRMESSRYNLQFKKFKQRFSEIQSPRI